MPYAIHEIEMSEGVPRLSVPASDTGLALVVRRGGRPVGFVMRELAAGADLSSDEVRGIIEGTVPEHRLVAATGPADSSLQDFPSLTIAVCSKDNPDELARCLESLLAARAAARAWNIELLVVDNAPSDERTRQWVDSLPEVRYAREPRPGLDFARNCALREAKGELLSFIDDDVRVDRGWLDGLAEALTENPDAAAFTGLVLPAELDTDAQILFERRGGFEKRFETIRYGREMPEHPFYPCVGGMFGTGCNMAFRRRVLLDLGGFDEALDAGATLPGGGDTDMLFRVVRAGHPLVYEPRFLVFHRHRRGYDQLRRQFARSWAQGLMAFVHKSYRKDPAQRTNLRRLVAWWFKTNLRSLFDSLRGRHVLPPDILIAELWGAIAGLCWAYPRSARRAAKIRRQFT